ncbi:metalloregulator ArsR/SmtB family transcription factor [Pyxidicoccus caerfyrddinensis]|uniref:metalloregulator ArsR/SmtB family transcription factor n=1 Tax=Pyxidicoccus caerfyrddinensis TaxID=2709663 RepID=UPI0013D96B18|nr:metalloregulator ArsR/SmtB family transcription factor [Pyxidicoccus caerfyrddinensis]
MDAFTALSDPTRRRIVELLAGGERSAGELGASFDISAPAISQHLKVLKEARLVQVRAEAQRRIYALDAAGLDELEGWVDRIRGFWNERLDVLERRLAAHPETKKRRRP